VTAAAAAAAAAAARAWSRSGAGARRRRARADADRKRGELPEHVGRAAFGTYDRLLARADELLEVRLALHAGVLVDRHGPSVLSDAVDAWSVPALQGRIVRLEPLAREHEEGLWEASRDPRTWRWLSVVQPQARDEWHAFVEQALEAAREGTELPLVTRSGEQIVGSTRFLALRPEHRSVEIGWTWLHPSAWNTGANAEAKLLQLVHAFETWGCRRVELKTDALNERSRRALEALGATFEGIHRKHMLVRGGENRDSAWYSVTDDDWPAVRAQLESRLAAK
jgi:RimJ/RimL family protein N-acetyltransferase